MQETSTSQQPPQNTIYPPQPPMYPPPTYQPPQKPPQSRKRLWLIIGIVVAILLVGGLINGAITGTQKQTTTNAPVVQPTEQVTTQSEPTQAPTEVSQPTTTPIPIPTIAPISLSGAGQQASHKFQLQQGLAIFKMTHDGTSNFAIVLYDSNGQYIDLLVNKIGPFDGSKAESIPNDGIYLFDVQADGNWTISIQ